MTNFGSFQLTIAVTSLLTSLSHSNNLAVTTNMIRHVYFELYSTCLKYDSTFCELVGESPISLTVVFLSFEIIFQTNKDFLEIGQDDLPQKRRIAGQNLMA